jgi:phosphate starvation-inducible PhoH-like protein
MFAEEMIELLTIAEAQALFGSRDQNIRKLRDIFSVNVVARNTMVKFSGESDKVQEASALVREIVERMRSTPYFSPQAICDMFSERLESARGPETLAASKMNGEMNPRTEGQRLYAEAIEKNDIVLCVGPAGTGKTFLAVAAAIRHLKDGRVRKIVLVRPAVEAGEKLGFLPGDFQAKINPYLRPLYDSLYYLLDGDTVKKYIERDLIEICPLAYMRGRTLSNAFIILDEGQNTTGAQMKMFLTRMGENSKILVTGDITQIDLQRPADSGLVKAIHLLDGIKGIAVVRMTKKDIVRHRLVQDIIDAYDRSKKTK